MSVSKAVDNVVESRSDLISYLEDGCKSRDAWRIGTEHEKFCFRVSDKSPLSYDGEDGICELLTRFAQRFGWKPLLEGTNIIGLFDATTGGAVSLEPGGQLELSGAPLETLHQTCNELFVHLKQFRTVGDELGIGFLGLGFAPTWSRAQISHMPKSRYKIMKNYMPMVGGKGLDMMYRSCTVQVNLDFSSEGDMVKKLRVGLALQSVATALFANSPFTEGRANGFLSYRAEVWRDTDDRRTGLLPFAFEPGMGFERYVDYALDVPMYFIRRNGGYIDVAGSSFRSFMAGELDVLPGEKPMMSDWADHLSTIFPDVRVKKFLEMRGADGGSWKRLCALPAFWVGLLYEQDVLDAASDLISDWTEQERQALRDMVPRMGLKTPFRKGILQDVALRVVELAREGLTRRARSNERDVDESVFMETLDGIVRSGEEPASYLLRRFEGEWHGDVSRVFDEEAY